MSYTSIATQFLKMQKLGKDNRIKNDPDIVYKAAKHNLREIKAELHPNSTSRINSKRSYLNTVLRGKSTAAEVVIENEQLMKKANVSVKRIDNIRGVELIFSLPKQFSMDGNACFEDFALWVESYFPQSPIISAVTHWDESTPHIHVILLPLIDGKLQGHKLMGNLSAIHKMRESCNAIVGTKYGIELQKRETVDHNENSRIASYALDAICKNPELLKDVEIKAVLTSSIKRDAAKLYKLLQRSNRKQLRKPKAPTFASIMISKVKPDKREHFKPN